MTIKAKIYAVIAIVAVFGAGYGVYHLLNKAPQNKGNVDVASITTFEACNKAGFPTIKHYPDQCQTSDGRIFVNENPPSEAELAKAELAIRTFMGDPNLELVYMTQKRHPANFSVLSNVKQNDGGFTADNPEEWYRPVYIFQQKNYIDDRCEVYQYQVLIKTSQVVEIGIVYPEEVTTMTASGKNKTCTDYGSLEIPLKTKNEIEQIAFAYFGRDPEHTKFMLRSDIGPEYIPSAQAYSGVANPAANEWRWEDKNVSLPDGLTGDPWQHPIARIIISSGGKLVYYLNTTDLFKN